MAAINAAAIGVRIGAGPAIVWKYDERSARRGSNYDERDNRYGDREAVVTADDNDGGTTAEREIARARGDRGALQSISGIPDGTSGPEGH